MRESVSVPNGYALSVRDRYRVTHYKIQRDNEQFFIVTWATFKSVMDLITHYQQHSDDVKINLRYPCVSSERPQTAGLCKKTNNEDWETDRRKIRLIKSLGTGQYSQVWGGFWNETTRVAVKILKPDSTDTSDFLREVSLMKKLTHPKIIQLFAVCTRNPPYYIITEFMKHGSLKDYLRSTPVSGKLKLSQVVSIAEQVAEGMAYLVKEQYVHRDLAARNVLVGEGLVCKVADFGLMQSMDEADVMQSSDEADESQIKFAIKWTAPEAIFWNNFSFKSDVWSFGVLLYEIITYGRNPYPSFTNGEVMCKLQEGYRMPQPKECSDMFYNIILKCWRAEPENRPTFEGLLFELEEFLEFTRASAFVYISGKSAN